METKITGTMIPVLVLGEHYGRTPSDLFDEIVLGVAQPVPDNGDMMRGRWLEDHVIDEVCKQEGYILESKQAEPALQMTDYLASGHIDATVRSGKDLVVLEIKCPRSHKSRRIGEDGCPREYVLQAAWYAMLTDAARSEVIVWDCDSWDYRKFVVPRNDKLEALMIGRATAFATSCLLGERPGAVDSAADEVPVIGQLAVDADEYLDGLCRELAQIDTQMAVFEAREKEIRAEVAARWPENAKTVRSVWGSLSMQDGRVTRSLDEKKLVLANPAINLDDYRTQKKGKPFVSFRAKKETVQ